MKCEYLLVGLMCQHPNPLAVADGPELMIRAVREATSDGKCRPLQ